MSTQLAAERIGSELASPVSRVRLGVRVSRGTAMIRGAMIPGRATTRYGRSMAARGRNTAAPGRKATILGRRMTVPVIGPGPGQVSVRVIGEGHRHDEGYEQEGVLSKQDRVLRVWVACL